MSSSRDRWAKFSTRNAGREVLGAAKRPAWGPREYLTYGFVGAVIAGIVFGLSASNGGGYELYGLIFAAVAGGWFGIGIVAQGVAVGMREHRREQL